MKIFQNTIDNTENVWYHITVIYDIVQMLQKRRTLIEYQITVVLLKYSPYNTNAYAD